MKRALSYIILFIFCGTAKLAAQTATDSVYTIVEKMPEFPGGQEKFMKYLTLIDYPTCNIQHIENTMLYIEFTVSKTGEIYNSNILRSVCKEIDEAVLKSINAMPTWVPGIHNGEKVNVKIRLPIELELRL